MITGFLQANSRNYRVGRTSPIQYIVVHYTANKGDTAKNNADYFHNYKPVTSAHYFVDENEIWQSVRESDTAYHCGSTRYKHPYCRNGNSVGVEICMLDRAGNVRQGAIDKACKLVKELMSRLNIPVENVIRHYDVTGKNCPAPMVEKFERWEVFKQNLVKEGDEDDMEYPDWATKTYTWLKDMPEWAQGPVQKAIKKGVVAVNADMSVTVPGVSLQTIVYLDRLGLLD